MIVNPNLSAHEYQEVITWKQNQIYFDTINNKKHGFNLYPIFKFGTGVFGLHQSFITSQIDAITTI